MAMMSSTQLWYVTMRASLSESLHFPMATSIFVVWLPALVAVSSMNSWRTSMWMFKISTFEGSCPIGSIRGKCVGRGKGGGCIGVEEEEDVLVV